MIFARRLVPIAGLLTAWLLAAPLALGDVSLPSVFGDDMVIQRDKPVKVFGTAKPGEKVTVALAGQTATTRANGKGRWTATLEALEAGGTHELVVRGKTNEVRHTGVLVGEVWVCSGQSNMQWPVNRSADPEREIEAAMHPGIRLFQVPRRAAPEPAADVDARWERCTPMTAARFSAVAYYFGRWLHNELGVPIGLVHTSYGGTPAEAWMEPEALRKTKALRPLAARWAKAVEAHARRPGNRDPRVSPHRPGNLWNAMVAPLVPFTVRGVIWYQGESNAGRAEQYRTLFPAMIRSWREAWDEPRLPFHFVQLANWRPVKPEPGPSTWAELREAQWLTLQNVPATGMATAIDIGEANDIHPKNKQDVGKRLALWALAKQYGRDVVHSGPVFEAASKAKDGSAVVTFTHAGRGLQTNDDDPPRGFAVAGKDRVFHWAQAEIVDGAVRLTCPQVKRIVAIRYGWADNPDVNLQNVEGLPALPFRTDDWPLTTAGKH